MPSVQALLYVTQEFVFECDAFSLEIMAVLMQGNRPVAYFSMTLSSGILSKWMVGQT
jgi:hypothetical protein